MQPLKENELSSRHQVYDAIFTAYTFAGVIFLLGLPCTPFISTEFQTDAIVSFVFALFGQAVCFGATFFGLNRLPYDRLSGGIPRPLITFGPFLCAVVAFDLISRWTGEAFWSLPKNLKPPVDVTEGSPVQVEVV
ncbi:UBIQUITIN-CONJUGAT-2 domain-containing protein [Mycena chlorophos]|uniref:UBIQUITIN-CONJUGAT-2 domain-containing protein n=1 Tax=Mycena chlorophos TaxID=658473 RepID=A0A8H6TQB1_MYCCL|nr:UBIQUITIN-CONJUGAT-2 domain-containing protein [Mycena chlorophos]